MKFFFSGRRWTRPVSIWPASAARWRRCSAWTAIARVVVLFELLEDDARAVVQRHLAHRAGLVVDSICSYSGTKPIWCSSSWCSFEYV